MLFQKITVVGLFFLLAPNDRGYGHLAVSVKRNVSFAGAFAVRQLTDIVNAGAKLPKCTSASQ